MLDSGKVTGQVNLEVIKSICKAAMLAPSGDNCQPWRYEWNGRELHIVHDPIRAEHAFNRANHASYISLGTVIESIAIAATREGLQAIYELNDEKLKQGPSVSIRFETSNSKTDDLYRGLQIRSTDRRPYEGGSFEELFFDKIRKEAERFPLVRLYFQRQFSNEFLNYIDQADCFVWEHRETHRDLFRWIRFSVKDAKKTQDGMSWRNLGLSFAESRILALCKNFNFQRFMNRMIFLWKSRRHNRRLVKSSAGLGLITTQNKQLDALVQVGQLWFRVWCRLNLNGYGHQPMSSGIFPLYDSATGVFPRTRFQYVQLFELGRGLVQEAFGHGAGEIPAMMFRTGKSSLLPSNSRTLRRPLEKVFQWKA